MKPLPREFYAQWLAPRLATFRTARPEVRFQLIADEDADFTEANLDVAVRLVEGPGDLEGVQLAPGSEVTVAAPGGAQDAPPADAEFQKVTLTDQPGEPMDLAVLPDGRVLQTTRPGQL